MGVAEWLGLKSTAEKGLDIIDQFVENKDEANKLRAMFYITELQTKTIPLIDAFHKMGRQILAYLQMAFYFYCVKNNIPITVELVAGVSGVVTAYTLVKGKGK